MLKFFISLFTIIIPISQLFAQDNFDKKLYLGVEHGYIKIQDYSNKTSEELIKKYGGKITTTHDKTLTDIRFFSGYKFTKNLEIEFGYSTSNIINTDFNAETKDIFNRANTEISRHGYDYSLLIKPLNYKYFNNLFLRIGGTKYTTKTVLVTINYDSILLSKYNDSINRNRGDGLNFGIGYDFNINKNFDFRLSYSYLKNISGIFNYNNNRFAVAVIGKI